MLIGAHVSSAGGLDKAVDRAREIGCEAMQIFSQSPRTWRPTAHLEEDFAAFRERLARSPVKAVLIHASYLINCGSPDAELHEKSVAALTTTLRVGDGIRASGVVLHPGSSKGESLPGAMTRIGDAVARALRASDRCAVLFENTAGAGDTVGRAFAELAELIELVRAEDPDLAARVAVCLDSCHLLASGFDIRTPDGMRAVLDEFDETVGIGLLRCLHLNDSKTELGSNRDRHANLGEGELGRAGVRAFLGEPRVQELPVLLEVPGPEGKGPDAAQVGLAKRLHREGVKEYRL